jgi:hypothetical protein
VPCHRRDPAACRLPVSCVLLLHTNRRRRAHPRRRRRGHGGRRHGHGFRVVPWPHTAAASHGQSLDTHLAGGLVVARHWGLTAARGTRCWPYCGSDPVPLRGRCPSLRLSGAVLQGAPASRSPGEVQASHSLAACSGVALAPSAVVTMGWRCSCRCTTRRQAPRVPTVRFLYATWRMRSALIRYMPPGDSLHVRATLGGASVIRLRPWML